MSRTGADRVRDILAAPPESEHVWTAFWEDVREQRVGPIELAAVLAATASRRPDPGTFVPLVASLAPRDDGASEPLSALNIVGTGGGPSTFNLSTAAALVAAAAGTPMVKSGSRSYSSTRGALDLFGVLGVDLRRDIAGITADLATRSIAFVGTGVYPDVFLRIARSILPLGLGHFGQLFNSLGPFVADVPVRWQLTGVSSRLPWDCAASWADKRVDQHLWICDCELGADEMLSIASSRLRRPGGDTTVVEPGDLLPDGGTLEDLRPVPEPDHVLEHLHQVLTARLNPTATHTVALNAGAALLAAGRSGSLAEGIAVAMDAMTDGTAGAFLADLSSDVVPEPGAWETRSATPPVPHPVTAGAGS